MANKLIDTQMMINKIISSVDHNYRLKRLDTQLNEPTKQNSIKVPKVVMPTNKKMSGTNNFKLA